MVVAVAGSLPAKPLQSGGRGGIRTVYQFWGGKYAYH
jgi:hypothetical protein